MQVQKATWVDGVQGERAETEQRGAFNGNAQRDERVVHDGATVARGVLVSRARNFEMGEVHELGEGGHKGWNIGRSVEEGGILLDEKVRQFRGTVLGKLLPALRL